MAGYKELLAVEWNDRAVETFQTNFPAVPVYHGDIATLTVEQIVQQYGVQPGLLDVLDGSPPCQGFSTAGKRRLDDPRNSLFQEYVRILQGLQPKVFVMENVAGLVQGKMKLIFAEMMQALKESGYHVSARLMNVMYFQVPQHRQRVIFLGMRHDLDLLPIHPCALHVPLTLRVALHNVRNSPEDIREACYPSSTLSHRLLLCMHAGESGHLYHPRQAMFGLKRLRWDLPSRTILKDDGRGTSCQCCHPEKTRRLTIPEVKRVSSFPEQFHLCGTVGERWGQLGNAVPPLFMRAIAQHVRQLLAGSQQSTSSTPGNRVHSHLSGKEPPMPRKARSQPDSPPVEPLALEEVALADLKPHPQNYRDPQEEEAIATVSERHRPGAQAGRQRIF